MIIDIILIAVIVVVTLLALAYMITRREGDMASIAVDAFLYILAFTAITTLSIIGMFVGQWFLFWAIITGIVLSIEIGIITSLWSYLKAPF